MIIVEGLRVDYGAIQAVSSVGLTVSKGSIVALVGSNGAGKSSTLRAISGLTRPTHGTVKLEGADITGIPPHRIARRGLRHVPEGGGLFADMSVEDNLRTGLTGTRGGGASLDVAYQRFPVLAARRAQFAGSLSGGERQMLAIGRALVSQPKYLLLDEPSLGLAPLLIEEIFTIVSELRQEGVGILLVEQNASQALDLADFAYVIEAGAVAQSGPGRELRHDPTVIDRYLGVDEARDQKSESV